MEGQEDPPGSGPVQEDLGESLLTYVLKNVVALMWYFGASYLLNYLTREDSPSGGFDYGSSSDDDDEWDLDADWDVEAGRERG